MLSLSFLITMILQQEIITKSIKIGIQMIYLQFLPPKLRQRATTLKGRNYLTL